MEKKTILVKINNERTDKMSLDRIEKWNTIANKMSSRYEFVFLPSGGLYTTYEIIDNRNNE